MSDTKPEPDALSELQSLSNAIKILDKASRETCSEPLPVWLKLKHAKQMLEERVAQLIDDPDAIERT